MSELLSNATMFVFGVVVVAPWILIIRHGARLARIERTIGIRAPKEDRDD